MMASMVDALNTLVWMKTKDAQHGWNKPLSIVQKIINRDEKAKPSKYKVFKSPEEFEKAWKEINEG